MRIRVFAAIALSVMGGLAGAGEAISLRVDFGKSQGVVRPLHGVNKGPLAAGGMIDLTPQIKELAPPLTRLHDCQWPYPEVVDMHAVFRDPTADPEKAENYDWLLTDAYLEAVRATGSEIVYRLGESIEHGVVKRFAHPPRDYERWAAACVGIIRHYNEGWSDGKRLNIHYWEIWNEPENRPAMWSGSDEDYIRLYRAAARTIKGRFPELKVGGPALGYSGRFEGRRFVPSDLVTNFLAACRRDAVPLDFFSWHCYTTEPDELVARAKAIRELLDKHGFARTENHLNEWNYLPGNSWEAFSKAATPGLRHRFYEQMSGAEGAAFVAAALIELQDAPVDVCNFYHGETGGFGLFDEYGVPNKVFYAMRAFSELARMDGRVATDGKFPGKLAVLAAKKKNGSTGAVLVSNFTSECNNFELRVNGLKEAGNYRVWSLDAQRSWHEQANGKLKASEGMRFELTSPGVALVEFEEE